MQALRHNAGLTQEDLSHRTGVHTTYISDVERGARNPSWLVIVRLAEGLGVPLAVVGRTYDDAP